MTAAAQSRRQFAQVQSVRLGWEREKSLNGVGKVGSKAGLLRQPHRAEGSAAGSDGAQSPQTVCGVYLSWVSLSQSTHLPRRGVTTYNVRLLKGLGTVRVQKKAHEAQTATVSQRVPGASLSQNPLLSQNGN